MGLRAVPASEAWPQADAEKVQSYLITVPTADSSLPLRAQVYRLRYVNQHHDCPKPGSSLHHFGVWHGFIEWVFLSADLSAPVQSNLELRPCMTLV